MHPAVLRVFLWLCLVSFLATGCETARKAKAKRKGGQVSSKEETVLVGVIEMINPEQNYVLIRCDQQHALAAGTELTAIDASGTQSRLMLTPERKGMHLTADIKEGAPKVANLVIYRKPGAGAATPASVTTPDATAATSNGIPPASSTTSNVDTLPQTVEPMVIQPIPLEPLAPTTNQPAQTGPTKLQ